MSLCIITGSAGLVGSSAARHFASKGLDVIGIDNDLRAYFFGSDSSTAWNLAKLKSDLKELYRHEKTDIRDQAEIDRIFRSYGNNTSLIIHAAAQPSHDWAATAPHVDFSVNANGTLNLLEATRKHCPHASFIYLSTNKVYGDKPNSLPLVEQDTRWEVAKSHPFHRNGIDESMSVDQSTHSLFGASKLSADLLTQEYGRYFNINTACFRGGCLTGPGHSGAELHGFLAYLMKCAATATPYTIFGYKGKQVRDNIHSDDLVRAFDEYFQNPRPAATYNIGGGRHSNCSVLEAISICERITGNAMQWSYRDNNRTGDHIWWITDCTRFKNDYPTWEPKYDVPAILQEIYDANSTRWSKSQ